MKERSLHVETYHTTTIVAGVLSVFVKDIILTLECACIDPQA